MSAADPTPERPDAPPQSPRGRDRGICVSIISHGQGDLVDRLLGDLAALHDAAIGQVVVTVNQPDDAWQPLAAVRALPLVVVRNDRPLGFGANHNRAFAHCTEGCFAVVNPDIRLAADPFPPLLAALDGDPECELAVPVQANAVGARESFARPVPTPWNVVVRRLLPGARRVRAAGGATARPHWVAGAFMLWRSRRYAALGGFDERYFLYCEDVDICLRLQLAGRRFAVVEGAHVIHDARRTSIRSPRYVAWHVTSLLRLWSSPVFWRFLRQMPARSP